MKILRFGISDDDYGDLPTEQRSWHLAQERLSHETGLPWETVIASGWPSRGFAAEVERRLEGEQPDLVFFACAAFWVSYPSAPLVVQRSRLPLRKQLARAGFWAASKPFIGDRALFHRVRAAAVTAVARAFYFEPERALAHLEPAVRAAVRREHLAVAVRGPLPLNVPGGPSLRAEAEVRRARFDALLVELCRTLHVAYTGFAAGETHPREELLGDRIHVNAAGHARRAPAEAELMVRAWRAASGDE